MNRKQFIILFVISLIPFVFYSSLRHLPLGSDTYAFINNNCSEVIQQTNVVSGMKTFLSKTFFDLMPCSFPTIVFIEWLLFFLSVLILSFTGKLFDESFGWFYGVFLGLSMIGVTEFFKLEPISMAYPIIFLAFYFLLKYFVQQQLFFVPVENKRNKFVYLALILLGGLLWEGTIILFLASVFVFPWIALINFPLTVVLWNELSGGILISGVIESRMFVGIIYSMFLLPFLMLSFLKFNKQLKLMTTFLFLLLTVSLKFSLLIIPFSFLGISIALKHKRFGEITKYVLVTISISSLLMFGLMTPNYPPNQEHWNALKFAVKEADGNYIINDWSYGYWIHYLGGKTNYYAGGKNPKYNLEKGIIITNNQIDINAQLLIETKKIKVWKKK